MILCERRAEPIRALVVDDEALARSNLTVLLRRDPDVGSIDECASGAAAVAAIRTSKPDLLFLDVQMPECGGFDVLEMLGADMPRTIIFVTAYDEYALRAFDAGALDYLLKPFDDARFERALTRAKDKLTHYVPLKAQPTTRFIVKSPRQMLFIDAHDVAWVEAASYYACLHVGNETHVIRRPLAELERELDPSLFVRIHRSTIVNLRQILGLELQSNGEYEVVLKSGPRLRLSRRYRQRLQERMQAMAAIS